MVCSIHVVAQKIENNLLLVKLVLLLEKKGIYDEAEVREILEG